MASGGWIAAGIALNKVWRACETRDQAKIALHDALIASAVASRGRGYVDAPIMERKPGQEMVLRNIGSDDDEAYGTFGEVKEIPNSFWRSITRAEIIVENNWESGRFFNAFAEEPFFSGIALRERDVNSLVKKQLALKSDVALRPEPRKPRLRSAAWEQWVAAVACLAYEHRIEQGMTRVDLFDLINTKLGTWGLEYSEQSTVGPAMRAILARFASDPPVKPLA